MSNKKLNEALHLFQNGQFQKGKEILIKLNRKIRDNCDILYNLGMAHSELNELKSAGKMLKQCISIDPNYSNAYVALGMVYFKKEENRDAEHYFERALIVEPENPYANKNLGSLYAEQDKIEKAIDCYTKALKYIPNDFQLHYGIGLAFKLDSNNQQAQLHFEKVIEIAPNSPIADKAKKEINELAQVVTKPIRKEIVAFCKNALKLFDELGVEKMQKIVAEIAILGNSGLKYEKKYSIESLTGSFTGLELVAYMYVGLQEIAPNEDSGVDFSAEYQEALNTYNGV